MSEHADRIEEVFQDGDYIVALDGPVLETFYGPTAPSNRRHVKHVWVGFGSNRKGEANRIYVH